MLNAVAIGPNVPEINGNAVEANHQRLKLSCSSNLLPSMYIVLEGIPWVQEILLLFLFLCLIMLVWVAVHIFRGFLHRPVQARVIHGRLRRNCKLWIPL